MNCEICGQPIRDKPITAIIDRAKLMVCEKCAKHASGGLEVERPSRQPATPLKISQPTIKPVFEQPKRREKGGEELEVIENFGSIIRQAREKIGLNYEELGKRVNEKVSVIQRLESQKLVPDIKLAKKLEYTLKIKLLKEATVPVVDSKAISASEITLGDVVAIKRRK